MKFKRGIILIITMLLMTGCNKSATNTEQEATTTASVQAVSGTQSKEEQKPRRNKEPKILGEVGFDDDTALKVTDNMRDILKSTKKEYTIEDKKYDFTKYKGQYGNDDVHYPVLVSSQQDMTLINSIILARVAKLFVCDDEEETMDRELSYEIMTAEKDYISILFTGSEIGHELTAHPYSINFTVNFDLKHNKVLNRFAALKDFFDVNLDKLHSAMKAQLDKKDFGLYEQEKIDDIIEVGDDANMDFYIKREKLYLRYHFKDSDLYYVYVKFDIA